MIDRRWIGHRIPPRSVDVERGQIALFCKAIGETRAVYLDSTIARAAGYRDVLAPPTFAMALDMLAGKADLYDLLREMGVDLGRGVHGEQGFVYHAPIHAGDTITLAPEVTDLETKKGGALELITIRTRATNQFGHLIVELHNVAVART